MANIGFGAYRVSHRSDEHRAALKEALSLGCEYIDTSSNYTNGESEILIGEELKAFSGKVHLISKVGYIQGDNLKLVTDGKFSEDLVVINENLKHSIHPDFIEDQLKRSLERLQLSKIDTYLLHNPEYYLKTEESKKDIFYKRIEKALVKLEELFKKDLIGSYGISSNTFVDPKEEHTSVDIELIQDIITRNQLEGFLYIQFPMNLLELGALEKQFAGKNLIEFAKENGIKTMINRPFNSFTSQGFVRLCEYETRELSEDFAKKEFLRLTKTLKELWNSQRDDELDELEDLGIFKQVSQIWYKQNSTDAIEQIFYGHFFPLLTSVWGRSLNKEEAEPFFELFDLAIEFSRFNMSEQARSFKSIAIDKGLISSEDKNLQLLAIDKYKELGVDIILCGMKKSPYVKELSSYF